MLDAAELELEDESTIEEAFYLWKDSAADFADCLIGVTNVMAGCESTLTFDRSAATLRAFEQA